IDSNGPIFSQGVVKSFTDSLIAAPAARLIGFGSPTRTPPESHCKERLPGRVSGTLTKLLGGLHQQAPWARRIFLPERPTRKAHKVIRRVCGFATDPEDLSRQQYRLRYRKRRYSYRVGGS